MGVEGGDFFFELVKGSSIQMAAGNQLPSRAFSASIADSPSDMVGFAEIAAIS